jgi:glycolate oxidase FAD binding subunit
VASFVVDGAEGALTLLRVEGFGPSVSARTEALCALFGGHHVATLEPEPSRLAWRRIRDAAPFVGTGAAVWRCSVPPAAGPAIAAAAPAGSRAMLDWAGGLVWIGAPPEADAGAEAIRRAVHVSGGGHATLITAPLDVRTAVPTFHPAERGLDSLAARLRAGFDPEGVLNPGRMSR